MRITHGTRISQIAQTHLAGREIVEWTAAAPTARARRVSIEISTPLRSAGVLIPMVTRRASLATPGCRRS